MKLGSAVDEILVGHLEAGKGLFRGIRSAFDLDDARFIESFDVLAKLDLTFDNFSFDYTRLPDLAKLADRYPGVTIIVNHLGGKIDPDASAEEFANWQQCIDAVARCPNAVLKVGGAQQAAGSWLPPFHMRRRELADRIGGTLRVDVQVLRPRHRGIWPRPMHVRKQLPGRQGVRVVSNAVEHVQAHRHQGGLE